MIGEDRSALLQIGGAFEQALEVVAVEDVVTEDQGARLVTDKVAAEDEGLGQSVRAGLNAVAQVEAPLAAITEQGFKAWRVLRCGDDEDVAYT